MKTFPTLYYVLSAVIVTGLLLLVYVSVQQSYRTGANDPQVQIAHDMAAQLQQKHTALIVPSDTIDLAKSLSSFISLYNADQQPVQSTGYLHGVVPVVPKGVLDYARQNGEDRVTWQPEPGVRLATVVTYASGSITPYVVVGRSLNEVEIRESALVKMVVTTWITCLVLIVAVWVFQWWQQANHRK